MHSTDEVVAKIQFDAILDAKNPLNKEIAYQVEIGDEYSARRVEVAPTGKIISITLTGLDSK